MHIIHSSAEFGKDIIAKKLDEGIPVQYVFQLKAGDVNLGKFRAEIQPQLLEASVNNLSHPNFDASLNKQIIFVTTGVIKPPATLAFQEFNNFIRTKYDLEPIHSIEKLGLVDDFVKHGIEPFFALHNDPTLVGDFFDLYSKIRNNRALSTFDIEAYTRRWILTDGSNQINRLQIFLEAYLFSTLLDNNKQHYEAVLFIAALARFFLKNNLYSQHHEILREYVELIVSNMRKDIRLLYENKQLIADPASATGLLAIFKYPKICLHILELLSLNNLLHEKSNPDLSALITDIIDKERGWERPLSDNYAMSVGLVGLLLAKNGDIQLLEKFINNITIWACDRYCNLGLASLGSTEDEEFEQLLSEHLEGLVCQRAKSSFLASVLLDLAFLANDPSFYESIANEIRATSIIPERFHVLQDSDIYEYERIYNSFDPEFSRKYQKVYSRGIAVEAESNKVTVRSPGIFFIMFLLRDRFFPTFIAELL